MRSTWRSGTGIRRRRGVFGGWGIGRDTSCAQGWVPPAGTTLLCAGPARQLEAQAKDDPVLAKILENAEGDSDEIRSQLRGTGVPSISPASALNDILERRRAGETRPIDIK